MMNGLPRGGVLDYDRDSVTRREFDKGPICMTEFFKNFQPFGMNFRKLRNNVYEFYQFENVTSIQRSSLVIKILRKLPIYQN